MTHTELHKKLTTEGVITFNKQYLSQLIREGKIPFKVGANGRKIFKYHQVLKALAEGGQVVIDGNSEKTVTSTKIELYYWKGKLAQLEHDKKAGILLDRAEVEQKAFTVARVARDQLLALPERLTVDLMSANTLEDAKKLLTAELEAILEGVTPETLIS